MEKDGLVSEWIIPVMSGCKSEPDCWGIPATSCSFCPLNPWGNLERLLIQFSFPVPKLRFVASSEVSLLLSSAKASQKALCVMKLSFLPIHTQNPTELNSPGIRAGVFNVQSYELSCIQFNWDNWTKKKLNSRDPILCFSIHLNWSSQVVFL